MWQPQQHCSHAEFKDQLWIQISRFAEKLIIKVVRDIVLNDIHERCRVYFSN